MHPPGPDGGGFQCVITSRGPGVRPPPGAPAPAPRPGEGRHGSAPQAVGLGLGRHGLRRPERRAGPPRLAHSGQSRAALAADERDVSPHPGQPPSQADPGATRRHDPRLSRVRASRQRIAVRPLRTVEAVNPVSLARPRALKPGDRVAVLCASSPVEPGALAAGLDALRFAGLDPVAYPSARDPGTMRRYLAGDDAMRAGDLRSALTDPGIAGILFARGGSGAQRTLEAMDWDGLGPETGMPPKVLAGYSDVTAVLEAVAVRLGWASVFGPMVAIREGASHYSFGSLLRTLMRPEQATLIRYPRAVTVVPGLARGVTTGGTLCLLASSLATGTSRPARGGILLLEDVNEEDYRVDRMLTQLRRSGYLNGVAGIVAGTFTGCGPPETIQDILTERLGDLNVRMIAWANVGHGGLFQAFPYGIAAELDAATATLRLLDPPLS